MSFGCLSSDWHTKSKLETKRNPAANRYYCCPLNRKWMTTTVHTMGESHVHYWRFTGKLRFPVAGSAWWRVPVAALHQSSVSSAIISAKVVRPDDSMASEGDRAVIAHQASLLLTPQGMAPPLEQANFLDVLKEATAVELDTSLGAINFRRQLAKKKLVEHVLVVAHYHGLLLESHGSVVLDHLSYAAQPRRKQRLPSSRPAWQVASGATSGQRRRPHLNSNTFINRLGGL